MDRRKFLQILGAGASASALLPGAAWATETKSMAKVPASGHKLLIAHRGASSYAPENTLVAYELAIKQGADLVEQDLQITKDGILICSHDTTLEATTNVEDVFPDRFKERDVKGQKVKYWPIYDFTLAEIKKLKTGSRTEGEFPTTSIPTWQEAIDTIRGKAGLCPETKGEALYGKLGFNMEELVAALLKKNGLAKRDSDSRTPILMQSFSKDGLLNLREKGITHPMLWLGYASDKQATAKIGEAKKYGFDSVGPAKENVTAAFVKTAHAAGIKVIPYTFAPSAIAKGYTDLKSEMSHYLYDFGIDGLFTNNPDLFPRKPVPKA